MKNMNPKRRIVTLRECPCQDGGLSADPRRSVLRRVKILGYESINRRRYAPQVIRQAIGLYEGVKVNIDHTNNPHASRSYRDRFGKLENITVEEDGLFGSLRFNPEHAEARSVLWFAENMPDALGLSHNATGQGHDEAGTFVVEKIVAVRSVDLVADPATTRGLLESHRRHNADVLGPAPGQSTKRTKQDSSSMASVSRTKIVLNRFRRELRAEELARQRLHTHEGFLEALLHGVEAVTKPRSAMSDAEFKRRLLGQPDHSGRPATWLDDTLVQLLGKDEAARRRRRRGQ
jgi:hypothetical protein